MREDGLQTVLDQYVNGTPEKGWSCWMLDKLDKATYVLVICAEIDYRRFRGHEEPGKGKGVDWEGLLITQEIDDQRSKTTKFVPVVFASDHQLFITEPLRSATSYSLNSEENYQVLFDFLIGRAGVEPGIVGVSGVKSRRKLKSLHIDSSASEGIQKEKFRFYVL